VPDALLDVVVVSKVHGALLNPATVAALLDEWDDAFPLVDELEDDVEIVDVLK